MDSSFVLLTGSLSVAPSMMAWTVNLCSVTACVGVPEMVPSLIQGQSIGQRRVLQRPRHVRAIGHDGFQLSRIWNPHIPGFQAGCRNAGRGEYRCAVGKTGELRFIGRVISTAFVSVLDRVLRSRRQVLKCNQITVTDDGFPLAPGSAYSAPIFLTACCVNRDTILCSPLHCAYTGWHLGPGRDLFTGCSRLACKGTLRRFYSEIQVHLTACPAHLG